MIRWNGKRYIPAGLKPVMKSRTGAPVPGQPNARWVAGWIGGLGVPPAPPVPPPCDFTYQIVLPSPTPTPSATLTPTPTITPTTTITPTPTTTSTPTPTPSASVPAGDPDAAAYLADVVASGGTTNPTIEAAVNTLFTSLKSAGLYSKMIAMYPYVGSTASSHAINAKLNKSFDITWFGGMTHDISGSTGNGSNAYGDTNVSPSSFSVATEVSCGYYIVNGDTNDGVNGAFLGSTNYHLQLGTNYQNTWGWRSGNGNFTQTANGGNIDGSFNIIRTNNTEAKLYRNSVNVDTGTYPAGTITSTLSYFTFNMRGQNFFTNETQGFLYYANNILHSEVSTLDNIINTFQTSLGRNTYSPIDPDAQAYLDDVVASGGTIDATITSAVDTLFTDLKAAGVYSKLNNFYPMVGGVAGSHAINANRNKSYDLTFTGGWSHNSSGSTANGTNSYADTQYSPFVETTYSALTSGFYNTNYTTASGEKYNGSLNNVSPQEWVGFRSQGTSNRIHIAYPNATMSVNAGQQGLYIIGSNSSNQLIGWYNGSLTTTGGVISGILPNYNMYIGALNLNGSAYGYVDMAYSFWFNSNYRLSTTELTDLSTAINDFQTSLGRNTY